MSNLLKIADLNIVDDQVTYGDIREFACLTRHMPAHEGLNYHYDGRGELESLQGLITEED